MAAAIPTLDGVPYDIASRVPFYVGGRQLHNEPPGTPEAKLLCAEFTAQIAQSAKNMTPAHLVVSVHDKAQGA